MKISLNEVKKELARRHLFDFTKYTFQTFEPNQFHEVYFEILNRFAEGKIKKLIVSVPPQHGKSQGSSRQLPGYILGKNPNKKIAIASYSTTFARKFNRDVQRIIDDPKYYSLFPETTLNNSNVVTVSSSYLRNSDEFEIVNKLGSLKSIGRGGALTGSSVDIMIMDDLYKDYAEGNSPVIRESVFDWYTSVVKTRLHNDSQELIVFTRWHDDDLIGRLEKKEKVIKAKSFEDLENIPSGAWVKINYEAIKTGQPTELDNREEGVALWEEKHSIVKLKEVKELDGDKFECLYQGNPFNISGTLYSPFKTYTTTPQLSIIKNYTDTADKGDDYLCSICYGLPLEGDDENIYILDILYTPESMEFTEDWTAQMLIRNKVNQSDIESNNGGRSFARVIDAKTPGNITINWFHQSQNKESRIISNSATVNKTIVFPSDWAQRFPLFYEHLTRYKKKFNTNKHDDAADTLTGIIEKQADGVFWVG